jgi:transcription initiation factor TFIIIB Brf1 subunit/transcription initiation factor TFIIB
MDNFDLLEAAVEACKQQNSKDIEPVDDIAPTQVDDTLLVDTLLVDTLLVDTKKKECVVVQACIHSIIISNGNKVCEKCGLELPREIDNSKEWRYYGAQDTRHNGDPSRCHMRKIEERTINKDVENMGFSDKIIEKANSIYESVSQGKIFRGNSRKAIIFACIFHAYKLSGDPQPCDTLIDIFNLEKKVGLRGLKHVNLKIPADSEIKSTYITPEHLIVDIMNKFEATGEQKDDVISIYKKIANRSSILNRSRPQSVASGIVRYYILVNDKDISMTEFRAKVKLSELTINRIVKEIGILLDTPNII